MVPSLSLSILHLTYYTRICSSEVLKEPQIPQSVRGTVRILLLYPVVRVFGTFLQQSLQPLSESPSAAELLHRLTSVLQLVQG